MSRYYDRWPKYVSVGEQQTKAKRQMEKLRKKGKDIHPVEIEGRTIARSFWGKGWCQHLESFSDYSNRLPRGRRYVRNGSVCHLEIKPGLVEAMVSGSSLYKIKIKIKKLKPSDWKSIKAKCSGQIGSILELLQGNLSNEVMTIVSDRESGLFPQPSEIDLDCNCPDWAVMCKHVAAALYGVGNRLDEQPELLFLLRNVDAQELISAEMTLPDAKLASPGDALSDDQLGDIFDIDLAEGSALAPKAATKTKPQKQRSAKKAKAPKKSRKKTASSKSKKPSASKGKNLSPSLRSPKIPSKKRAKKTASIIKIAKLPHKKTSKPTSMTAAASRLRPSGKSVSRLRKQLGLTRSQFAKKLGVSPATAYNWESKDGRLKLRATSLNALAALSQKHKKK